MTHQNLMQSRQGKPKSGIAAKKLKDRKKKPGMNTQPATLRVAMRAWLIRANTNHVAIINDYGVVRLLSCV
jgi:hypothetical protein